MRSLVVLAVLISLGTRVGAEDPPPAKAKSLADHLGDADPFVRDAAAAAIVVRGGDAGLGLPEVFGRVVPGEQLGIGCKAAWASQNRLAIRNARRLSAATESSVAFWMHFEELLRLEPALRDAALRLAFGRGAASSRRRTGRTARARGRTARRSTP